MRINLIHQYMKTIIVACILFLTFTVPLFGQYDYVVKALNLTTEIFPHPLVGKFNVQIQNQKEGGIEYFEFSKPKYKFKYYPKQVGIDCGYFQVYDQILKLQGVYEHNLGCDLDYGSFELFEVSIDNKNYLLHTCIRYGSGSTTRNV